MLSVQRLLTGCFSCVHKHMYVYMWVREEPQMSFFKAYTPCSVRQSLICLEHSKQARLLAHEPSGPPVTASQCWAYTRVLQCLAVLCGSWIASRGPHTCATSALLGEPSPQSQRAACVGAGYHAGSSATLQLELRYLAIA